MSMNFATDVVVNDANTLQAKTIKALTAANASTFGVGTNGQVLKSNGTVTYWGDASYSNATTSSAGLMSAEDKAKLDSLSVMTYYETDLAIVTTDWATTAPYTYTWNNSNITTDCYVTVLFKTDPRSVLAGDLNYEKVSGGIQFTATALPTGTLNIVVQVINSNASGVLINQIIDQVQISLVENVSGTTPSIVAQPNIRYKCGELTTLSIIPPENGTCDIIFSSGTNATVLTIPNTVKFPSWFDPSSLDSSVIYEIMITDGIYGSVMTWAS